MWRASFRRISRHWPSRGSHFIKHFSSFFTVFFKPWLARDFHVTPDSLRNTQGLCETFDVALYVSPFRASDLAELVTFDGEGNMLRGTTAAEFGRVDTRRSLLGSRAAEGQKDTRRLNAGVNIPALGKLPSNSGIRGKSGHLGAGLGVRPLAGGAPRDPKKPLRFIIVRTFCPWDIDKLEVPLFPMKQTFMIFKIIIEYHSSS